MYMLQFMFICTFAHPRDCIYSWFNSLNIVLSFTQIFGFISYLPLVILSLSYTVIVYMTKSWILKQKANTGEGKYRGTG